MSSGADLQKQAQEIIFTCKVPRQKKNSAIIHFGMILKIKLEFLDNYKSILHKVNKTIDLLRKFHVFPWDIEILVSYPTGSVLPHGEVLL